MSVSLAATSSDTLPVHSSLAGLHIHAIGVRIEQGVHTLEIRTAGRVTTLAIGDEALADCGRLYRGIRMDVLYTLMVRLWGMELLGRESGEEHGDGTAQLATGIMLESHEIRADILGKDSETQSFAIFAAVLLTLAAETSTSSQAVN